MNRFKNKKVLDRTFTARIARHKRHAVSSSVKSSLLNQLLTVLPRLNEHTVRELNSVSMRIAEADQRHMHADSEVEVGLAESAE